MKIADYFGVSTDYLPGRTHVSSIDLETRAICEAVGLTEAALMIMQTPAAVISPWREAVNILIKNLKVKGAHRPVVDLVSLYLMHNPHETAPSTISVRDLKGVPTMLFKQNGTFQKQTDFTVDGAVIEGLLLHEIQQSLIEMKSNIKAHLGGDPNAEA